MIGKATPGGSGFGGGSVGRLVTGGTGVVGGVVIGGIVSGGTTSPGVAVTTKSERRNRSFGAGSTAATASEQIIVERAAAQFALREAQRRLPMSWPR